MAKLLGEMGVRVERSHDGQVTLHAAAHQGPDGVLRAGEDDARLGPGARPAARALRARQGLASRRLRDRRAAGRPAREGPGGDGRDDRDRARLHACERAAAARRAHRHGPRHRHRHREPDDGGGARRGRDAASRTPRASPKWWISRAASRRWARKSKARAATRSASRACARWAAPSTASCPTGSRPAPTSPPPRRPAAKCASPAPQPNRSTRPSTSCGRPAQAFPRLTVQSKLKWRIDRTRSAFAPHPIPASPPTCRRSSWRSPRSRAAPR